MNVCMGKRKKGIASFYIVAFSTLILLVIVMSFATFVVSQMERSSNDDLSQSAYDAALAGVEDAKLAFEKYLQCKYGDATGLDCNEIIRLIEGDRCDMVQEVLGRPSIGDKGVVEVKENTVGGGDSNNMQQAYTCVKIKTDVSEMAKTGGGSKAVVFKPQFQEQNGMKNLSKIKVSWKPTVNGGNHDTISVAIVQTPEGGVEFDSFVNDSKYSGMVYLEPSRDRDALNSVGSLNESEPIKIKCDSPENEKCVADISIPDIEGSRGDFEAIVSQPEGRDQDVTIEFFDDTNHVLKIMNQFEIDSTGRANDILRRVRVVVEVNYEEELRSTGVMGPLEVIDGQDIKN